MREVPAVAVGALLFGLAFSHPILRHFGRPGVLHDWDLLLQLQWVATETVARFHELPLWNPYKCGGMPLLANPHSRIVTPFFPLHLVFGPAVGVHLEIPLHLAIGWGGGYVLARVLGLGRLAGIVCGAVFAGSSWLYLHLLVGHVVYLPSLYLPWMAALLWLAVARRRLVLAAVAGWLVALTFFEGGVYPVPHALVLAGCLLLALTVAERNAWPIASLVVLLVFAACFAGVKLLPTYNLLQAHPRPWDIREASPPSLLLSGLFSRDQDLARDSAGLWLFHEYGAYVGILPAALAVLGLLSSPRRALPWAVTGAVLFLLAMGHFASYAPWALASRLPLASSARVPSRFLIPFTLTVAVLAAHGIEALRGRRGRLRVLAAGLVTAALMFDLWRIGPPMLAGTIATREVVVPSSSEFRQVEGEAGGGGLMLAYTKANLGSLGCSEYTTMRTTAVGADRPGYRGEQYLLGAGTVRLVGWTPNTLRYAVEASEPTVLVVNQNHDPGWSVRDGAGEVVSHGGLLAVRLPAGTHAVTLSYRGAFAVGLAISVMAGVALLLVWLVEPRNPPPVT